MKTRFLQITVLLVCFLLSGCAQTQGVSPSSSNPLGDTSQPFSKEESKEEPSASEEEPTESVLEELFCDAMFEINDLATEDPQDCMRRIFSDTEVYDDDQVTIDSFAFARTSKNYSELVEYYGNIFIDEALEWILSTKFADMDGTLYLRIDGGASGVGTELLSIEKLKENTYRSNYLRIYVSGESDEESTVFEVKKTDAGYRISNIDYHPDLLGRELLRDRLGVK